MSYDNTHKIRIKDLVSAVSGMKTLANGLDDRITALEGSSGSSGGSVEIPEIPGINCYHCAGTHNSIFRGKCLGTGKQGTSSTAFTDEQSAAIQAGTFDDMYIGDYWLVNVNSSTTIKFRIAAFDYFFNVYTNSSRELSHHVVIVPDEFLLDGENMNSTAITTNAYVGSDIYKNLESLLTQKGSMCYMFYLSPAFGDEHIVEHCSFLQDTCADGVVSNGNYYNVKYELMSEQMVFGKTIYGQAPTIGGYSQLPLFRLAGEFITGYNPDSQRFIGRYWLRDVVASYQYNSRFGNNPSTTTGNPKTQFVIVDLEGRPHFQTANLGSNYGIRPLFCIR